MKPFFPLAVCAAIAIFLPGCSKAPESSGGGTESTKGKTYKLAFITNNPSDFWTIARRGVEKADSELENASAEFLIPSDGTAAEQKRIVDDLLAKGVDAVAISPVDPANQTQMINDMAKQAVVFTQDSDAPQSQRACYIGTNNRSAGKQAGELIKEAIPKGGKIMVFVGKRDAQNAADRFQGIKDAIEGSNIEILDVLTDNVDHVRAKANVVETLVKYPDVACLVGLWSYNGPAILNAAKEAGKVGDVKIVCFDEEDETLQGVKDGSIYATVVQQPYEFGYQAIKLMTKVLEGDKSVIPEGKQIFVPTLAIKQDSVEEFIKRINQLRGRTSS